MSTSTATFTLKIPTSTSPIELFEKPTSVKMGSVQSISIKAFSDMLPTIIYSVFSTDLETKGISCNKTDLLIQSIFIDMKMVIFHPLLSGSATSSCITTSSAGAASGGAGTETVCADSRHPDEYLKTFVCSYSNKYRMPGDYQGLFKDSQENRFSYFLQALIKKTSELSDITESKDLSLRIDKFIFELIAAKTKDEGDKAVLLIKNYLSEKSYVIPEKDTSAEIEKIFLEFLVNQISVNPYLLKFLLKRYQENPSLEYPKLIVSLLIQPKLEEFEDPLAFCLSKIHSMLDQIGSEHTLNMKAVKENPKAISFPKSTIVGAKIKIKYNEHGEFCYKII